MSSGLFTGFSKRRKPIISEGNPLVGSQKGSPSYGIQLRNWFHLTAHGLPCLLLMGKISSPPGSVETLFKGGCPFCKTCCSKVLAFKFKKVVASPCSRHLMLRRGFKELTMNVPNPYFRFWTKMGLSFLLSWCPFEVGFEGNQKEHHHPFCKVRFLENHTHIVDRNCRLFA